MLKACRTVQPVGRPASKFAATDDVDDEDDDIIHVFGDTGSSLHCARNVVQPL